MFRQTYMDIKYPPANQRRCRKTIEKPDRKIINKWRVFHIYVNLLQDIGQGRDKYGTFHLILLTNQLLQLGIGTSVPHDYVEGL